MYRFFCAQVRRRYGNGQNDSGAFRIPECDLLVSRIRQRVASGGHAVPDQDVRRRRERSLQNLKGYADVMDKIRVFDTSEASPVLVYEKNGAALVYDAARFARIQKDLCL